MLAPSTDWLDPVTIPDIAPWWTLGGVFLRSGEKKQTKYWAKCRGCEKEIRAELQLCASHAISCKKLSLDQKDLFQAELSELRKGKASEALEDQDMELSTWI